MKKYCLLFMIALIMSMQAPAFSDNIRGTVDSVHSGLIVIDIWGGNQEEEFKLIEATQAPLDDLKVGDKVNIYYDGEGYQKIATAIIKEYPSGQVAVF